MTKPDVEQFWTKELGEDVEIIARGWQSAPTDYALYISGTYMVAYKRLEEIEDWITRYMLTKEYV